MDGPIEFLENAGPSATVALLIDSWRVFVKICDCIMEAKKVEKLVKSTRSEKRKLQGEEESHTESKCRKSDESDPEISAQLAKARTTKSSSPCLDVCSTKRMKKGGRPGNSPITIEIQDDNDNTEKVLDNPNKVLLLGKALKHSKETKFDENTSNVQDEVNKSFNENIEKVLDNPNDNPRACIPLLKKAQELLKKYEDYV